MNTDAKALSADDEAELRALEALLHQLIRERNRRNPDLHTQGFELPSLIELVRTGKREEYYPVPGMYGGFNVRVLCEGGAWHLVCESWCRVVGGSGQRHRITRDGVTLLEQGFV